MQGWRGGESGFRLGTNELVIDNMKTLRDVVLGLEQLADSAPVQN